MPDWARYSERDKPSSDVTAPVDSRLPSEHDRDRVIYSSAFQRLAGITQVTSPGTGPIFHNRLTHSLKVAQLAERLAQSLKRNAPSTGPLERLLDDLDVDAVEAAALAHDIGHPPFGHIAEQELDKVAKDWGGFEGNAQSFRIVTFLSQRDPDLTLRGLDLTRVSLNGLLKYPWLRDRTDPDRKRKWGAYSSERAVFEWAREHQPDGRRTLEAEIMDWADDVTYAVHDMEDFHRVGLIPLDRLIHDTAERKRFFESFFEGTGRQRRLRGKFSSHGLTKGELENAFSFLFNDVFQTAGIRAYDGSRESRSLLRATSSLLIGRYVNCFKSKPGGPEDRLVSIDRPAIAEVAILKELAWFYIIKRPSLVALQHGQRRIVQELHEIYKEAATGSDPESLLPVSHMQVLRETDNPRAVTDLVAGLTEGMAFELHHRLTGVRPGSILDAAALSDR